MKIEIAVAINKNYLQHFFVLLESIKNNKSNFDSYIINVMHTNLNIKEMSLLRDCFNGIFEFKFYEIANFQKSPISAHISIETYYRIILPNILSKNLNKVLYLDSDIIVNKNLADLWLVDIKSYALGAVFDHKVQTRKEELNIPNNFVYFNAGVLLINLDYWRKHNLSENLLKFIRNYPDKLLYHDQDAINALLYDQVYLLNDKWNVQTASFESKEIDEKVLKNPAIIHFTGASKPWHISNNNPYKSKYYQYLKLTPFKDFDVITTETKELLKRKKKLYIWGAGKTGKAVYEFLKIKIEGFIDSDFQRVGSFYLGHLIYSIDQIEKTEDVGIVVCSGHFREISKELEKRGYEKNIDFVHQM